MHKTSHELKVMATCIHTPTGCIIFQEKTDYRSTDEEREQVTCMRCTRNIAFSPHSTNNFNCVVGECRE